MRYVCIHSHCYQPPRENPWLESIEVQESAYPYHDWNDRITAECYAPNTASRILDGEHNIVRIVNNYSQTSFNFGPTLLSWMEDNAAEGYHAIIAADRESRERFGGHGSALAQPYNHMILPLANSRDKQTQIIWGIEDFRRRFGREPEGMWLPEAAVDSESLELMAEAGIKFTVLSPYQARRVRGLASDHWVDVANGNIDPKRPYLLRLPSGWTIFVFFYDGPVSQAVAFERLLDSGEKFAGRLLSAFSSDREHDELVHIATDGETYGHHHAHGEMALSYALHHLESKGLAKLTNYSEYLATHAPTHEVEIKENSSWSCSHGVARWSRNCGCSTGGHRGWSQNWRQPLRSALDWVRDAITPHYEAAARDLVHNPWIARDRYVRVILDRTPERRSLFIRQHCLHGLEHDEEVRLWKLMELQRHAMLMYTSCGWFFDEISGIETVQVLRYAGRVVQLAEELFGLSLEKTFCEKLAQAKSNLPEYKDGENIYMTMVKPAMINLEKLAAHYAISSMFESYPDRAQIYCYTVDREEYATAETGRFRMAMGKARFISEITQETQDLSFGVFHFGDHNLTGGVREFGEREVYTELSKQVREAFNRADVPEVIRLLDRGFGTSIYSIKSLFTDEQRKILDQILKSTLLDAENAYRGVYEHHAPLMRFLNGLNLPVPEIIRNAAGYALNSLMRNAFEARPLDIERIRTLLEEAKFAGTQLDTTTLEFALRKRIERISDRVYAEPMDLDALERLHAVLALQPHLPFKLHLWSVQNKCYELLHSEYLKMRKLADHGDAESLEWLHMFDLVAGQLKLKIEVPERASTKR